MEVESRQEGADARAGAKDASTKPQHTRPAAGNPRALLNMVGRDLCLPDCPGPFSGSTIGGAVLGKSRSGTRNRVKSESGPGAPESAVTVTPFYLPQHHASSSTLYPTVLLRWRSLPCSCSVLREFCGERLPACVALVFLHLPVYSAPSCARSRA